MTTVREKISKKYSITKRFVSYSKYSMILSELVENIKNSKKKFDYVCGLTRGGLPIAVHLSHNLKCKFITQSELCETVIAGYSVLIVDDIADTGKSFEGIKVFLKERSLNKEYFASLFYKQRSSVKPDYYNNLIPDNEWIVFPWETGSEEPNR
ncbi:MAG: phosphoribosyltransferase domain-containing protein [Melioribacteraceae bacterium]|jgi:hypoxanthine phosphoribosyltransferase|nr:phosphoribosyltransferase domain-containing protein [Melioribacteraceae bacterium]